jgi:glutamine amidotransferase
MSNLNHARVAIIDYEAGNLFSVHHACKAVGLEPVITRTAKEVAEADAVILPGVGAFGPAMENLRKLDLVLPLLDFAKSGKPLLGICLGMQLLFTESEEFGNHKGLGIIPGNVVRFPLKSEKKIRVPQIGWNRLQKPSKDVDPWFHTALKHVPNGSFMYFVHSYYVQPNDSKHILSLSNYGGIEYCSAIIEGNVTATQFHPEKSADEGMKIYRYWAKHITTCKES